MDNAFAFIELNGGICTEADYPYVSGSTERQGTCQQKSCKKVTNATPRSYNDVEINSEVRLRHPTKSTHLLMVTCMTDRNAPPLKRLLVLSRPL